MSSSMRSRAVSLPRLCCASMRAAPPSGAGAGAPVLELLEDILHLATTSQRRLNVHRPSAKASINTPPSKNDAGLGPSLSNHWV